MARFVRTILWSKGAVYFCVCNVIYRGDRVIIPDSLRCVVLDILHAAHQGVSGIKVRVATFVWWPGMKADISEQHDARCEWCDISFPSQPSIPPFEVEFPKYPMQSICSDIVQIVQITENLSSKFLDVIVDEL